MKFNQKPKKTMFCTLALAILIILLGSLAIASDVPQPAPKQDPFTTPSQTLSLTGSSKNSLDFDISPNPLSMMGSECSNVYSTTGEYCSGQVRIYYQCLKTMDGPEWQQRSENCEDYSGRCIEEEGKAKCVDGYGQTTHGKKILWIGLVLLIIGVAVATVTSLGIIHPLIGGILSASIIIYALWILTKFILGGV